jgi:hypothetical protein
MGPEAKNDCAGKGQQQITALLDNIRINKAISIITTQNLAM